MIILPLMTEKEVEVVDIIAVETIGKRVGKVESETICRTSCS
jgi:hypothetical protein